MTLDQLGNIGELVGGLAVVASLLYVGVQLRQNSRVTKSAVRQSIASRASEFQLAVAQNEEAFLQHREGFLEDDYWNKRGDLMLNYLRHPGMVESWKPGFRSTYHPAFVEWVERHLRECAA